MTQNAREPIAEADQRLIAGLPAEYGLKADRAYEERESHEDLDPLCESRIRPTLAAIFVELDAAGAGDFVIERDIVAAMQREAI